MTDKHALGVERLTGLMRVVDGCEPEKKAHVLRGYLVAHLERSTSLLRYLAADDANSPDTPLATISKFRLREIIRDLFGDENLPEAENAGACRRDV